MLIDFSEEQNATSSQPTPHSPSDRERPTAVTANGFLSSSSKFPSSSTPCTSKENRTGCYVDELQNNSAPSLQPIVSPYTASPVANRTHTVLNATETQRQHSNSSVSIPSSLTYSEPSNVPSTVTPSSMTYQTIPSTFHVSLPSMEPSQLNDTEVDPEKMMGRTFNTSQPISGLHIAFFGDSVTRYQYIDLIHLLHTGKWTPERSGKDDRNNMMFEKTFESQLDMYNFQYDYFDKKEICDCYRADTDKGMDLDNIYVNRYYMDEERDNYVTYIARLGRHVSQGHWLSPEIRPGSELRLDYSNRTHVKPAVWKYDFGDVVRYIIGELNPQPRYLVINQGAWKRSAIKPWKFRQIQAALNETNITAIYKTTTKIWHDADEDQWRQHDKLGCQLFYCLDLSWTARLNSSEEYFDEVHFRPHVNHQFNQQLFRLIEEIERNRTST